MTTADSSGLGANRVLIRFKPEGIETSEETPRSLRFSAAINREGGNENP